jgi:carboxyl-terminal processing protease
MRNKISLLLLIFSLSQIEIQAQLSEKDRFEISKNLDIYVSVFEKLMLNYVDTLNPQQIIRENIGLMLEQLDPYTEYISEEELSDFQFQTTGEYGGIGAIITSKGNKIIVVEPYEGMPAALAGLQAGDQILEIDGIKMDNKLSSFASEKLKGQSATKVKLKILRSGEKKPFEVNIERKRIHIDPITYYGVMENGTGYIYFSGFTAESAQSVKAAIIDLMENQHISSLIFDVRDNGGGVMEDCLEMLNFFLPKGKILLSLKGKSQALNRIYRTTQDPIAPNLPLVVLVNRNSASASEIFAGAIQDLDRGVIVGTRTFGKGLVQSTQILPYGGSLKLTTAKYYIPSDRSIQAIDYSQKNDDGRGSYIPDSLTKVFYTSVGRPVRDGGGILPDFVIEEEKIPTIVYYLEGQYIFFDFVVQWREKHPVIASPADFVLTDEIYEAFKDFVKSQHFTYDRQSENTMETLKAVMEFEGYMKIATEEFQALENKLKPDLDRDLNLYKEQISKYLCIQLMKQYYFNKGEVIHSLKNDAGLDKAIEILKDKEIYNSTLSAPVPADER